MAQPCRKSTETPRVGKSALPQRPLQLPDEFSQLKGQMEPGQSCAYNQTRECFLGLHVVAGDLSGASLQEWVATLKPNSGAGMWLIPFRGIAATDATVPLDLLYLDSDCRVIETVEFFPTFKVSPSCPPAASVLALPAHSIFSSQTQAGDQLMLCPADEMEWRLERLARTGTLGGAAHSVMPRPVQAPVLGPVLVRPLAEQAAASVLVPDLPAPAVEPPAVQEAPKARVMLRAIPAEPMTPMTPPPQAVVPQAGYQVDEPSAPAYFQPAIQPAIQPVEPEPAKPQKAENPKEAKPWLDPARKPAKSSLGWLGKLLMAEPGDPRAKARRTVDGLVAYFFTGGAPHAHPIRDISPTGLYVVTSERWYPGTVIRMTLSIAGSEEHPLERSITIHAKSVRWGNDGVGLEFILAAPGKQGRGAAPEVAPVDSQRLDQFLKRHGNAGQ
jgi:hypothetical protein